MPALTGEISDPPTTYPNLVPDVGNVYMLRPLVWDEPSETFVEAEPELWFDTWAQNLGSVPLQITVDDVQSFETSTVSQCVSWIERICRKQVPVGGYTWHTDHVHYHFEEFASYELRRVDADGAVDYSAAGLLRKSDKVSFCMVDSQQVRDDAAPVPVYNQCTPTVQGVSPGWTDIYDASLPGQQFSFDGLPDGRYGLVVAVNYGNRLHETNHDDNVVEVILDVSGGLTEVSIVERRYP